MRSTGAGKDDEHSGCPKCQRFISDAEMVAFRVDAIQVKLKTIEKFLADNEWIFLENAELMKKVKSLEHDVDMESFDLTRRQIVRFNRYIDKVTRAINQISNDGDSFCREQENGQENDSE